jgi:acetyl-CoA carboxylase/biotin carboxylase 1
LVIFRFSFFFTEISPLMPIPLSYDQIIEEGPITAASADTVRQLEDGACRLARAVGYVGAATVEYLYTEADGAFYFLELNPRLQVEHPVTEWIAGINLPSSQLNVGMGIPLWKLPGNRSFLYGACLFGRLCVL